MRDAIGVNEPGAKPREDFLNRQQRQLNQRHPATVHHRV
jgi:hypothetical protein